MIISPLGKKSCAALIAITAALALAASIELGNASLVPVVGASASNGKAAVMPVRPMMAANFTGAGASGGCGNLTTGPTTPLVPSPCGGTKPPGLDNGMGPGPGGTTGGPGGGGTTGGGGSGGGTTGGGGGPGGGGTTGGGRRGDPVPFGIPEWRMSGQPGLQGATGHGSFGSIFQGPVATHESHPTLFDAIPEPEQTIDQVARWEQGIVEAGLRGLRLPELDAEYPGITPQMNLVIGRRYFSRLDFNGQGSVGIKWVHSFTERLIFINSQTIYHFDWNRPFNDSEEHFTEVSPGQFEGAAFLGAVIVASTSYPGAAYKMTFKNKDVHYFDAAGKILARVDWTGLNKIEFEYDASGDLEKVTDSRGKEFTVTTTAGLIDSITDPRGNTISYISSNDQLIEVTYPSVDSYPNGGGAVGGGGSQTSSVGGGSGLTPTTGTTNRTFEYNTDGFLQRVRNGYGDHFLSFTYTDGIAGKVERIYNPYSGLWFFYEPPELPGALVVKNPRHFVTIFYSDLSDDDRAITKVQTFIQPLTQADLNAIGDMKPLPLAIRPQTGLYEWNFVRDACGLPLVVQEPDSGGYVYSYDASLNLTAVHKTANGAGTATPLTWTWTYGTDGYVQTYTPPHGNAAANPADFTFTYTRTPVTSGANAGGIIRTISTPAGNIRSVPTVWTKEFDANGRPIRAEGPDHDSTTLGVYDAWTHHPMGTPGAGLPLRHYTRRDHSIWSEANYDEAGNLISATTNDGGTFTQEFDAQNRLEAWNAPALGSQQYRIEILYDVESRPVLWRRKYFDDDPSVGTAAAGWFQIYFEWDGYNNLKRRWRDIDPASSQKAMVEYWYDHDGALFCVTDEDGKWSGYQLDDRNLPWLIFDAFNTPQQVMREAFYDLDGRVCRVIEPFDGASTVEVLTEYDDFDRPWKMSVANGAVVTTEYDASTRPTVSKTYGFASGVQKLVKEERFTYGDWHDQFRHRELDVYDSQGNGLLRTIEIDFEHGPSGKNLSYAMEGQVLAEMEYHPWGALKRIFDSSGNEESFDYSVANGYAVGHTMKMADPVAGSPVSYTRTFENDIFGRLKKMRYKATGMPDQVYQYQHDSMDNIVRFVDPLGKVSEGDFRFDGLLKELRRDVTAQGSGSVELLSYSIGGLLQTATDAGSTISGSQANRTVTWEYDDRLRREKEKYDDGTEWSWEFFPGDFIKKVTTPKGKTVDFVYNGRGFLQSRTIALMGTTLRTDSYDWDPAGFLKLAIKTEAGASTSVSFTRDALGKVLTEDVDGHLVTYGRDALGRVTSLASPSGVTRTFTYNQWNRVATVDDGGASPVATLDYYGPSPSLRRSVTRDGSVLDVHRDGFGRVDRLHTTQGPTTKFDFVYGLADNGLINFENRVHDGKADVYRYDGLDRLRSYTRDSDNPANELLLTGSSNHTYVRDWNIDEAGYRSSVDTTPQGGATFTEGFIADPDRYQYTNVGGSIRTFDADGNLATHGMRSFGYDAVDNLSTVTDNGTLTASYKYDALDRRVEITQNGKTLRFVHAGSWLLDEFEVIGGAEVFEAAHFYAAGADEVVMSRRVDHADLDNDGSVVDQVDLYFHRNIQGSVMEITRDNGFTVESYRYDPFGAPTVLDASGTVVASPPSGNRFMFTGREYDDAAGLYHFRARAYDPGTGHFLQEDPLGFAAGLNPVAFLDHTPTMGVDPEGTDLVDDAKNLAWDLMKFMREHGDLIVDILLDLGPIGDLIDLLSAVTGKDIKAFVKRGFKGAFTDLSTWERIVGGVSAGVALFGGAVAIIAKLKGVFAKIKLIMKRKEDAERANSLRAAQRLAASCPSGCFAAGTLVLLASGSQVPIEDVDLGAEVCAVSSRALTESGYRAEGNEAESGAERLFEFHFRFPEDPGAELVLLRPESWGERYGLVEGRELPIGMSHARIRGVGTVTAIRECAGITDEGVPELNVGVVTGTFSRVAESAVRLVLEDDPFGILLTGSHPVFSESRRSWVPAAELVAGELVVTNRGETTGVRSVAWHRHPVRVYNLEVGASSTFFVGAAGVLVHNACPRVAKLRKEFQSVKPEFLKDLASKGGNFSAAEIQRLSSGKTIIGADGFPMEVHHVIPLRDGGTNDFSNLVLMTQTDHRRGANFKKNHP